MKFCTVKKLKKIFLILLFINLAISAFPQEKKENIDTKISGFRFYLTDKYGKQKGIINGLKADFISPDEIEIKEAKAQLTDIGKFPVILQTPYCVFIKSKEKITTEKKITIKTKGINIEGKGMEWELKKKVLIIKKNVVVNIERNAVNKISGNEN